MVVVDELGSLVVKALVQVLFKGLFRPLMSVLTTVKSCAVFKISALVCHAMHIEERLFIVRFSVVFVAMRVEAAEAVLL